MEPGFLVVVLRANPQKLVAVRIIEPGNPGSEWSKLMTQVEIVNARAGRKVNSQSQFGFELVGMFDGLLGLLL